MAVFTNAARRRVDRVSAAVGALAFLLGVVGVTWGALTPPNTPSTISSTVVASPIPGDVRTRTVQTTLPPTSPTRAPRVTTEVTTEQAPTAGEVVVTTGPAPVEAAFLGSSVASIVFQLILVALLALLLAFGTQRVLLGEYGIRPSVFAKEERHDIVGGDEVDDVKRDVVAAGEQRDATRPLFDTAGVPDPRLRLLQSRIALEQEVRKLAQDNEVPSNLSVPAVVKGLVEKKRMSPRLAGAVVTLIDLGERLSRGADLSVDTMTTLTEAYAQALGKVGGKIRNR